MEPRSGTASLGHWREKLRNESGRRPPRKRAAQQDGPQCIALLGMLGVGGAFVGCLVDLPFALAPMSPLLSGLVIGGKLCLGSSEAAAAGCIRWS